MKANFFKFFIFLILTLISSCSYNFSDDNFINIETPTLKDQVVTILNFQENDTINIDTNLSYTFNNKLNQNTVNSKVFLDNEIISSVWEFGKGSFTIKPSRYNDGQHTIRIEHTFTSGSGSIKDQTGLEFLTLSQSYKFVIKRNPSTPPPITSVSIENGSIRIDWNSSENSDFENAYLNLKFKHSERRIALTPNEIKHNKYIDTSTKLLVGPENSWRQDILTFVEYSIVYSSTYEELKGSGKRITFDPNWINLEIEYLNSDSYKIKWDKYPLYNNAKEFTFGFDTFRFNGSTLGGEKIINKPYVIGRKYTASVSFENFSVYYLADEIPLENNSFNLFSVDNYQIIDVLYNSYTKKYYALVLKNNALYIYEYSQEMIVLREKYITSDSPYSNYNAPQIFNLNPSNNNFHIETSNGSYEIDKDNLNIVEKYENNNTSGSFLSVLRNDILYKYDTSSFKLFLEVKNLKSNNIIFSGKLNAPSNVFLADGGILSNDAKYLYIPDYNKNIGTVYEIVNDNLEKVIDIKGRPRIKFYNNKVLYELDQKIYLVDLDTKVIESFEPFHQGRLITFDPLSNKVFLVKEGAAEIYDLTLKTSKRLNYEETKGERYHKEIYFVFFQNNRLIYSNGMYFDNY
ncbi:YncE family protein [Polaribacter septentrionalilitoris]|uniref:hypothetical protein n=1 Tax=Polaribacter septentrionalilitoris TaxID=2494657 RepID=UPI001356A392|nr:hypothetical protein [Polaribacter septentrionalilitoris]